MTASEAHQVPPPELRKEEQPEIIEATNRSPTSPGEAPLDAVNVNQADRLAHVAQKRLELLRREKGARSQAGRRHKLTVRFTNTSIVLLSTYIFGTSVILTVLDDFVKLHTEVMRATNLTMSFFLVAFSLLQSFKRHDTRSELFVRCSQALRNIRSDIERELVLGRLTEKSFRAYDEDFKQVLRSYRDSPGEMDAKVFQFMMDREAGTSRTVRRFLAGCFWQIIWMFYIVKSLLFAAMLPFIVYFVYITFVRNAGVPPGG